MNTNMHVGGGRRSIWKGPAFITALILSIPLLRSLFASGWDWDVRVFLLVGAVGTLLFSMGLACQMVIRNLGTTVYRGKVAFRPAIVNWRTGPADVDLVVPTVLELGASLTFFGQSHAQVLVIENGFEGVCESARIVAWHGEGGIGAPLRDVPDGRPDGGHAYRGCLQHDERTSLVTRAHDGHAHKIMGTITARDEARIRVKTPGGEDLSIQINAKTLVTRDKRKVTPAEVQAGRRVVVDIGNGEDPLTAREIQVGATKITD